MSCGAGRHSGYDFDKLFAARFNELDSLISSSPSSPEIVVNSRPSSCIPCEGLKLPKEGGGQETLQWVAFLLLVFGIALLLMYMFKKLKKTRDTRGGLFGSMVLPSVGAPKTTTGGEAKAPMGTGAMDADAAGSKVKVVKDPSEIIPTSDNKVTIIMFFAEWCGHCKHLKPTFMKASAMHPDANFSLVENTVLEKHPKLDTFQVTGFPHISAFKGSKQVGKTQGNQPIEKLNEFIEAMKKM